jgi:hypothetical protein
MFHRPSARFAAAALALAAFVAVGAAWQPAPSAPAQPPATPSTGGDKAPAQPTPPGPRGPGARGPGGQGARGPNVEAAMKGMDRAVKQLGKQITDASKKEENLRLVNDMERGCVMAKGAPVPQDVLAKAKDDAEKAKWSAEYRKQLFSALRVMVDLEQDILDGKNDDAAKKLAQITKLREESHKILGVKEE